MVEELEDRRLLALTFDPSFTHVANPPVSQPSWPEGHVGVFVPGEAAAMVRQTDGKLVLGGWAKPGTDPFQFGLVRMNEDGTPDATFDGDGIVISPFFGTHDLVRTLALDDLSTVEIEKIVVAGSVKPEGSSPEIFGVKRFLPGGSPDPEFQGTNDEPGEVSIRFPDMVSARPLGVTIDDQGRIVVVGLARDNQNPAQTHFALARLLPNGQTDDSFNGNGKLTFQVSGADMNVARSVESYRDSTGQTKILVSGWSGGEMNHFTAFRLTEGGALDQDFGSGGVRVINELGFNINSQAWGMVRQSNEYIVLAGMLGGTLLSPRPSDFAIVRLLPSASGLDTNFGGDGIVTHHFQDIDEARGVALQNDGTIVISGFTSPDGGIADMHVARFNGDRGLPRPDRFYVPQYRRTCGPGVGSAGGSAEPDCGRGLSHAAICLAGPASSIGHSACVRRRPSLRHDLSNGRGH
jgi:uncharacterized delta-60 repeat protein